MTTTKKTAVAKTNQVSNLPDYGEHAGKGTSDLSQQERGLPFLKTLQPLSPEIIGPKGKVEGAAAGMFLDTGTELLYETITLVPAIRLHVIQEWRPRAQGGGLVNQTLIPPQGVYPKFYAESVERCKAEGRKYGKFWTGDVDKSNQLKECYQLFAVVLDENGKPGSTVVVPFSSTFIKVYREQFANRIGKLPGEPPFFMAPIVLTTEQDSNDDGTWFLPRITFPVENNPRKSAFTDLTDPAYLAAAKLHDLVKAGLVKADVAQDPGQTGGETGDGKSIF